MENTTTNGHVIPPGYFGWMNESMKWMNSMKAQVFGGNKHIYTYYRHVHTSMYGAVMMMLMTLIWLINTRSWNVELTLVLLNEREISRRLHYVKCGKQQNRYNNHWKFNMLLHIFRVNSIKHVIMLSSCIAEFK